MTERLEPDAEAVVATALERAPTLGSTRLISLDGPAGSGKTTLAGAIETAAAERGITCAVLHLDDLYEGWEGLDRDLEPRLLAQVLSPIAAGATARWQRYDWYAAQFAEWIEVPSVELLVLEGCGSGAADYADYITLLVWLEAERDERIRRGVARAGDDVLPHWLDWMEREERRFAANHTRDRADIRYRTD